MTKLTTNQTSRIAKIVAAVERSNQRFIRSEMRAAGLTPAQIERECRGTTVSKELHREVRRLVICEGRLSDGYMIRLAKTLSQSL
jgi:hypothetical protein